MKHSFALEGYPYIMLNNLLKALHLVGTGGEANIRISEGEVVVNGMVELQKRKKIKAGDTVEFGSHTIDVTA
jgi:ribosome-associated protein